MNAERVATTAFVLNGGGNLGAVQVGMLQALLEAGIKPDAVVGTSIGALNGAFLAGHSDPAGVNELAELWASVRRRDVFPMSVGALVRGVFGHQPFLVESLGLRSLLMRAQFGFERLEDAPVPLRVIATDLQTGDAVVLSTGDTIRALLASSAIPGVLPAVEIEGRMLIDGAVAANSPIAQAEEFDPSIVYVLPTVPDKLLVPPGNAIEMIQRAMALTAYPAERRALAEASSHRAVRVVPVPAEAGKLSIFDFRATRQLIRDSYELTTTWLEATGSPGENVREVPALKSVGPSEATA